MIHRNSSSDWPISISLNGRVHVLEEASIGPNVDYWNQGNASTILDCMEFIARSNSQISRHVFRQDKPIVRRNNKR